MQPRFINLHQPGAGVNVAAILSTSGAAIKSLCVNGVELFAPTEGHDLNPFFDGIVLAPWANRIDRGRWQHNGETLQLPVNETALNNALHGLVATAVFDVAAKTNSSVTLETRILPSTGFPFELLISVCYQLTMDGIEVTHSASNLGAVPAPYVGGAHPYFQISGNDSRDLEFKTDAQTVYVVNDRMIAVDQVAVSSTNLNVGSWQKLSDCNLDHGFCDLLRDDQGRGHHYLRSPKRELLTIWQSAQMTHSFIFTPHEYFTNDDKNRRQAIAIEPQTGAANAFNNQETLSWLQPGQTHAASWGVKFAALAT